MKTFTKTTVTTEKLLKISYDMDAESPRDNDGNLGYFITKDSKYSSPDKNEQLENIMCTSADEAQNQEDHIQIMSNLINTETEEQVIAIYPIVKYEHSGISYSLGQINGFDYSNNGFYIITDKTQKASGVKKANFEKAIKEELEIYNQYANGEVYQFVLFDEDGEVVDSCGGFYNIDDIKEYLPEDWKDENMQNYFNA